MRGTPPRGLGGGKPPPGLVLKCEAVTVDSAFCTGGPFCLFLCFQLASQGAIFAFFLLGFLSALSLIGPFSAGYKEAPSCPAPPPAAPAPGAGRESYNRGQLWAERQKRLAQEQGRRRGRQRDAGGEQPWRDTDRQTLLKEEKERQKNKGTQRNSLGSYSY